MKIFIALFIGFFLISAPVSAKDKFLDIQEIESASGIKAWLVEDRSLPIIAVSFSFKDAGSIQNSREQQGLAQLLSNTMDEGAGDLKSQEFQKALSDNSITLYFNSSRDNFGGKLKTLSRNKDKAFELLELALNKPRFDAEPVERMRQSNMARIRSSKGDPNWINARIFNDKLYGDHPYAFNSGGTLTTLASLTPEDLKQHHKNWIAQSNLVIGITGDISKTEAVLVLDDVFGNLPKQAKENKIEPVNLINENKNFVFEKDIPQTIITAAMPSLPMDDPDYKALQVMNYIYGGGGFGSKLMEEAREKRGLTYGIYSSLFNPELTNLIKISTSTKNKSVNEMMNIIEAQMAVIKNDKVDKETLKDAQSYITGSLPLSLTSTDKVAGILVSLQLDNRSVTYLDDFINDINAVTRDDIQRVANKVLDPKKMTTIMVGNPENIESKETVSELPNVE